MDFSLQDLRHRLAQLPDHPPDLKDGIHRAIDITDLDPEMALTRSRKVLELVIRDIYERRCQEPPGTRPLENLIQRLVKDGHLPDRLDAYATTVRKLGNVGTHTFGERITAGDVYRSLSQLLPILEWYFEIERGGQAASDSASPAVEASSLDRPPARLAVVPKGLRSFDSHDADFFLELVPGPRDKAGLPAIIRFWKHRIEAADELTFTVGVLYGPSGCGKSSLVKAGLLPRLSSKVISIYVEATAADTEARLIKGLRKRFPDLPANLDLTGIITFLRQPQSLPAGHKLLVVIDQFEQWLHAIPLGTPSQEGGSAQLVQALRQCDGEHVQALVMVRDDFWLALSRFMSSLNIELVQGQNIALVDLFDLDHARKVLTAFGLAFGRVDDPPTNQQQQFIAQTVGGLAQDDRVISVRLALCAEMVKSKAWTPATLKQIGGTQGLGVTFLEETFGVAASGVRHRYHLKAAQAVLNALLPETGSDIKGNMSSYSKLLDVSGYAPRPADFDELLRILDGELRLITPTQPAGSEEAEQPGEKYYQLTHDYLVPSLRDWLTRKQKETRRGRAELLLADRATVWNDRPENRQLPSLAQWLRIRWLTERKNWTEPQSKMMRRAAQFHAVRALLLVVALSVLALAGAVIRGVVVERQRADHAEALVQRLLDAKVDQVPTIINDMQSYRSWVDPLLRKANADAPAESQEKLYTSLALLPVEPDQKEYLRDRLLKASADEVPILREALSPFKTELEGDLWGTVEKPAKGSEPQVLRAACALAAYDPDNSRWDTAAGAVADQLIAENPVFLGQWLTGFRFVRAKLLAPLAAIFRDIKRRETDRILAANILADYAADQPELLSDLVMDADEQQFVILFPKLANHQEIASRLLRGELNKQSSSGDTEEQKDALVKRQANSAVALLRIDPAADIWSQLKHTEDPRRRSFLVHRMGPLGADLDSLVKRLDRENDLSIRRALILSMGGFGEKEWPPVERKKVMGKMKDWFVTERDPGMHAAAEWLLRSWGQGDWTLQQDEREKTQGKQHVEDFMAKWARDRERTAPQWYVNGQGQTMVMIAGPIKFDMGSSISEKDRFAPETPHEMLIPRSFAIAAKPVTVKQFHEFDPKHKFTERYAPTPDCPVITVFWHHAAAYCNWLSEQEGLKPDQFCYETDSQGQVTRLKKDYLHLTGYRLPTSAEMEYACRAGSRTSRFYGSAEELLPYYAWYVNDSDGQTHPVGSKQPNDFGLFDVLGNVWNWCQDRYIRGDDPPRTRDDEEPLVINNLDNRVVRCGAYNVLPWNLRSANFNFHLPIHRDIFIGFRVARTIAVDGER